MLTPIGLTRSNSYRKGVLYIGAGDLVPDAVLGPTTGIHINQGAAADAIFVGKSSDIAHGATTLADTDTFLTIKKTSPTGGGVHLSAFSDAQTGEGATLVFLGASVSTVDTTKSTAGLGLITIYGSKLSGTGYADVTADGNIFAVRARLSSAFSTVLILDEDGDLWLNSGGKGITLSGAGVTGGSDSAPVADEVSLGAYEIGAANRVLAISQETAVAADVDETKFSHKMQVRINGATYFIMLTAT